MCKEPTDVFAFLKTKEIGSALSLRYIAHACVLEVRGDFVGADAEFQSGLAVYVMPLALCCCEAVTNPFSLHSNAQPHAQLQSHYDQFMQRMAQRIRRVASTGGVDPDQTPAAAADENAPFRSSLAALSTRGHVGTIRTPAFPAATAVPLTGSFAAAASARPQQQQQQQAVGKFAIFSDDGDAVADPAALSRSVLPSAVAVAIATGSLGAAQTKPALPVFGVRAGSTDSAEPTNSAISAPTADAGAGVSAMWRGTLPSEPQLKKENQAAPQPWNKSKVWVSHFALVV